MELGLSACERVAPTFKSIKALNKVIESTFGQSLDENFLQDISELKDCLTSAGISITPKVIEIFSIYFQVDQLQAHILFEHVPEFLQAANRNDQAQSLGILFIKSSIE